MEIAGLNIPHIFLMGKNAPNCILKSNFLAKTAAEVYFKANKLYLHQEDKTKTAPLQEEPYNQEEEEKEERNIEAKKKA